jgi:hypothetical protein
MRRLDGSVRVLRRARAEKTLPACIVGHIVEFSADGHPCVDYAGNEAGPLSARSTLDPGVAPAPGTPVLLVFENGDPLRPIILGCPRDGGGSTAPSSATVAAVAQQELIFKPKSLVVEAGREIVLRCGPASVTLRADGTVVVRGTRLLSRSSGTNRIKGAAVRIN